jgi:hypothetical protein
MFSNEKQMRYYYRKKGSITYKQQIRRNLNTIRMKSRQQGIPCTITIDDLILNKICPVLGIPLSFTLDRDHTPSIDKIDVRNGYVPGNVRVISFRANRWKNNMTFEEANLLIMNWNKIST